MEEIIWIIEVYYTRCIIYAFSFATLPPPRFILLEAPTPMGFHTLIGPDTRWVGFRDGFISGGRFITLYRGGGLDFMVKF